MFSATVEFYDLIYRKLKDYRAEAATVAALVRAHNEKASRLLDVACGTGEHAFYLRTEHGFEVDGVDLDPHFVELARTKNPDGAFSCADMSEFALDRQYDAVICLFSSIGYALELTKLGQSMASMGRHVAPGGLLLIEPWLEPGIIDDGRISCTTASADGITVCRMARTEVVGRRSRIQFEYLIGTREGLRREHEFHDLGLFTRAEMEESLRSAGYEPSHDPEGLTGRGLYIARRTS